MAVRHLDHAGIGREGAEGLVRRRDAHGLPRRVGVHDGKELNKALLLGRKHPRELAQVGNDEPDGVERPSGMAACPPMPCAVMRVTPERTSSMVRAVGVCFRGGKLRSVDGELNDRLARDGVRGLGARPAD